MSNLLSIRFRSLKSESRRVSSIIGTALFFSLLATLIPTGMYKNLGYVDPNMYVGYGVNSSWLVNYVGYEYHATRLPLIFLISLLLQFPPVLFGFLFKFTCLSMISLTWFCTCQNFNIRKSNSYLGAFVLLLSPLAISSSSWTFPNSFAMLLGIAVIPVITKAEYRRKDFYFLGFVLTNVAIMNVLFAALIAVFIAPIFYRQKVAFSTMSIFRLLFGSLMTWMAFELIWKLVLDFPGSIYRPQFDATFGINTWSDEYWKPVSYIIANKPLAINLISFLSIAVIVNTSIYTLISKEKRPTNLTVLHLSNILFVFTIIFLYFFKAYIGFSELWYFYIVFFSYFVSLIMIFLSSNKLINDVLPKTLAISTCLIYLKFQLEFNPNSKSTIILVTFLLAFFIMQQVIDSTTKFRNGLISFKLVLIFVGTVLSWTILFFNPMLKNAYSSSDINANTKYLKNQIWLLENVASLGATAKSVALYTGPDASGILGGLESTLSFHMIRLDGRKGGSPEINLDNWVSSRGEKPESIIVLLDRNIQSSSTNKGYLDLEIPGYCSVSDRWLPEFDKKITVLAKRENC